MAHTRYRRRLLISLVAITPLGFAGKLYHGPLDRWVTDYAAGMLYEMFWIFLLLLIWPSLTPARVGLGVFMGTSGLEFLQLWHPPALEAIRATFLGRTLIGTSFSWWDFLHYGVGCLTGYYLAKSAKQQDYSADT